MTTSVPVDEEPPTYMEATLRRHVIGTHYAGELMAYVQTDEHTTGGKVVFVTVHDTGTNHRGSLIEVTLLSPQVVGSLAALPMHHSMAAVRARATFVHVVLPGHDDFAPTLPRDYEYPSLDMLAHDLNDVLDALQCKTVIGIGEGAGASILARFALNFPNRLHGLVAFDFAADGPAVGEQVVQALCKATAKGNKWVEKAAHVLGQQELSAYLQQRPAHPDDTRLNASNVAQYVMVHAQSVPPSRVTVSLDYGCRRDDLRDRVSAGMDVNTLLVVGKLSAKHRRVHKTAQRMDMTRTTLMTVDDTADPLTTHTQNVSRALILFCKSCGMLLGVPMPGLEEAYAKVQAKIDGRHVADADNDEQRRMARLLLDRERQLGAVLDGE